MLKSAQWTEGTTPTGSVHNLGVFKKDMGEEKMEALEKAGVEVYLPTPEEREAFAKLLRPVYGKLISPEIAEMFLKAASANK